jgi:hypothetical protein
MAISHPAFNRLVLVNRTSMQTSMPFRTKHTSIAVKLRVAKMELALLLTDPPGQ